MMNVMTTTEENECDDEAAILARFRRCFPWWKLCILVWGVGLALINSDFGSDSGTDRLITISNESL